MSEDPFARFERSRGGWLIPILLFFMGAVPTAFAIRELDQQALLKETVDEEAAEPQPAADPASEESGGSGGESVSVTESTDRSAAAVDSSDSEIGEENE